MAKSYDFSGISVLAVDDNSHMLSIIKALLKGFGIVSVTTATNARDGFDRFCKTPTDLVIVDFAMENIDGLKLVEQIRTPEKSPNIYVPIIMISAYSELSRVKNARDAGITEYLCKPVSARALYQRIVEIIERPRPFVRSKVFFGPDRRRHSADDFIGTERRIEEPELIEVEGENALSAAS